MLLCLMEKDPQPRHGVLDVFCTPQDSFSFDSLPTSVTTPFLLCSSVQTPQGGHFGHLEMQPFHCPHLVKVSVVQSPITTYFGGRKEHKPVQFHYPKSNPFSQLYLFVQTLSFGSPDTFSSTELYGVLVTERTFQVLYLFHKGLGKQYRGKVGERERKKVREESG